MILCLEFKRLVEQSPQDLRRRYPLTCGLHPFGKKKWMWAVLAIWIALWKLTLQVLELLEVDENICGNWCGVHWWSTGLPQPPAIPSSAMQEHLPLETGWAVGCFKIFFLHPFRRPCKVPARCSRSLPWYMGDKTAACLSWPFMAEYLNHTGRRSRILWSYKFGCWYPRLLRDGH